ncbi:MAG: DUF342 domain-containing protein, partial [Planctomycetota bacterium]
MRTRKVSIEADGDEAAMRQAVAMLGATPGDIRLEDVGNGRYQAVLENADAEIEVRPSPDAMEAMVADYVPGSGTGRPLSRDTVKEQLTRTGIEAEPDRDGLQQLIDRAGRGLDVRGIVIARGTLPEDGQDGRLELLVKTGQSVGMLGADGSVNFYERDTVHSVAEGELLGRLIPPGDGTPGRDVQGHVDPARRGKPARVSAGANVEACEDGLEFRAKKAGMVMFAHNVLSITETIEVPGDVDFSSGNVRMKTGSVVVKGTIRGGFAVTASGNIVVGEAIENAVVEAGGDINVNWGIVMRQGGHLKAEGNVYAHFAANAT